MTAFIHKPKGPLSEVYVSPVHTETRWAHLWAEARKQPWYEDGLGYVGNKDGYHYFQKRELTTGFARLKLDE